MQSVLNLPDSAIAQAAIELSQSTESPSVFNHSVRSYLFGELLAAHEGLRAGADYDSEALFLGCVLHDLGAGSAAPGKERFEVEGADLAAALLTEHGCGRAMVDAVWEAIALHTSFGIADRRGPLCYLVRGGVGVDFGRNADFSTSRPPRRSTRGIRGWRWHARCWTRSWRTRSAAPTRRRPIRCPVMHCANGRPTASPWWNLRRCTAVGASDGLGPGEQPLPQLLTARGHVVAVRTAGQHERGDVGAVAVKPSLGARLW